MANDLKNYNPVLMNGGVISDAGETITGTLAVSSTSTLTGLATLTAGATTPTTLTSVNAGAATSGGNTTPIIQAGTALTGIYFGAGAPSITAPQGSLYLRTDGTSTSTRAYVNLGGTTAWTGITTAA